jgi:hypothetical protein
VILAGSVKFKITVDGQYKLAGMVDVNVKEMHSGYSATEVWKGIEILSDWDTEALRYAGAQMLS